MGGSPGVRRLRSRIPDHRHVAVGDAVLGWVTGSAVSSRCVYAGVVEHSIYVDPTAQRRGVGQALLDALIRSIEVGRHASQGNRWRDVVFIERRSPRVR